MQATMSKALIAVALVAALCAAAIYQAGALGALCWAMGRTKCVLCIFQVAVGGYHA